MECGTVRHTVVHRHSNVNHSLTKTHKTSLAGFARNGPRTPWRFLYRMLPPPHPATTPLAAGRWQGGRTGDWLPDTTAPGYHYQLIRAGGPTRTTCMASGSWPAKRWGLLDKWISVSGVRRVQ